MNVSKRYVGLGDDVEVTVFERHRRVVTYTAKWWMRPICWLLRKPTTQKVVQ